MTWRKEKRKKKEAGSELLQLGPDGVDKWRDGGAETDEEKLSWSMHTWEAGLILPSGARPKQLLGMVEVGRVIPDVALGSHVSS